MSFEKLGFFSPEIERFRRSVRETPECQPWFEIATDLIRLGLDALGAIDVSVGDRARLTAAIIFSQVHESLQAGILLAERGMVTDARTIARSAVEGAIALFALSEDETFVDRLIGSHYRHSLIVTRLVLETPEANNDLTPEQMARLQDQLAMLQSLPPERRASINWADVGGKHCPGIYDTMYRILSNDGPHVSIALISRRVEMEGDRVNKIKVGPDIERLTETMNACCGAFLHALTAFLKLFPNSEHEDRLRQISERYASAPASDPTW